MQSRKYIVLGRHNELTLIFDDSKKAEEFCKSGIFNGFRDITPEQIDSTVVVHHRGGIDFVLWYKKICNSITRLPGMPCDTYKFA